MVADASARSDRGHDEQSLRVALVPVVHERWTSGPTSRHLPTSPRSSTRTSSAARSSTWRQLLATYSDEGGPVSSRMPRHKTRSDFTSADGESILYMAARRGYERAAKLLLEYKVDTGVQVSAMGNDFGDTALHVLVSNVQTESNALLRIVCMLLAHPETDPHLQRAGKCVVLPCAVGSACACLRRILIAPHGPHPLAPSTPSGHPIWRWRQSTRSSWLLSVRGSRGHDRGNAHRRTRRRQPRIHASPAPRLKTCASQTCSSASTRGSQRSSRVPPPSVGPRAQAAHHRDQQQAQVHQARGRGLRLPVVVERWAWAVDPPGRHNATIATIIKPRASPTARR